MPQLNNNQYAELAAEEYDEDNDNKSTGVENDGKITGVDINDKSTESGSTVATDEAD